MGSIWREHARRSYHVGPSICGWNESWQGCSVSRREANCFQEPVKIFTFLYLDYLWSGWHEETVHRQCAAFPFSEGRTWWRRLSSRRHLVPESSRYVGNIWVGLCHDATVRIEWQLVDIANASYHKVSVSVYDTLGNDSVGKWPISGLNLTTHATDRIYVKPFTAFVQLALTWAAVSTMPMSLWCFQLRTISLRFWSSNQNYQHWRWLSTLTQSHPKASSC